MSTTTYRYAGTNYEFQADAEKAVMADKGWDYCATSDSFAVGVREGKRGSVYGVSCYPSEEECEADEEGAHAPRILIVTGDEAYAMGRDEAV